MQTTFIVSVARISSPPPLGNAVNQTKRSRVHGIAHNGEAAASTVLQRVSEAIRLWQIRTNSPSNWLPTNSVVRRCEVAKELQLSTLINKAGGYRQVQHLLNLQPPLSAARSYQEREVTKMAFLLRSACEAHGLPAPEERFPTLNQIRQMSPILANRIASFPGRRGYGRLAEYVKSCSSSSMTSLSSNAQQHDDAQAWGVWTSTDFILYKLRQYQSHPRIMPRLCSLPTSIACAIQRKGGVALFAQEGNMILEKDVEKMSRFLSLCRWLDNMVTTDDGKLPYIDVLRLQAENPPQFPSSREAHKWEMETNIARCGGRRYLSMRLGFAAESGMKGIRMGPFSVRLAADLLEFSLREVLVSVDGNLAMPSVKYLRQKGEFDLATATEMFGGEAAVGRRIGLIPDISASDGSDVIVLRNLRDNAV